MKVAQAVGRSCGQDDCTQKMVLKSRSVTAELKLGGSKTRLTLQGIPVAVCPGCGYEYLGDDSEEAERLALRRAVDEYWTRTLMAAGARAAEIVKLRLICREVARCATEPNAALEQLGVWLGRMQDKKPAGKPAVRRRAPRIKAG